MTFRPNRSQRTELDGSLLKEATDAARTAAKHAYAPRSEFGVGAAVITSNGGIYQGNNVESVISGLGTCAERSAIDHAVAHGEYVFDAIVTTVFPCGACLQYIYEFAEVGEKDIAVITLSADGGHSIEYITDLLKTPFGPLGLGLDLARFRK